MAVKQTPEQIAAAAKQNAISSIQSILPELKNPERFIGKKNNADFLKAKNAYVDENLGLKSSVFKQDANPNLKSLAQAQQAYSFKTQGVQNLESMVNKKGVFDLSKAEASLIKDVYKDDPAKYQVKRGQVETGKTIQDPKTGGQVPEKIDVYGYNIGLAKQRFDAEQPKLQVSAEYPKSFTQAVTNYSDLFQNAVSIGIENLNDADKNALKNAGRIVRDFGGKGTTETQQAIIDRINDVDDAINTYTTKSKLIAAQARTIKGTPERRALTDIEKNQITPAKEQKAANQKLESDRQSLIQNLSDIKNLSPRFQESFTRYNLSDVVQGIGGVAGVSKLRTGLEAGAQLRGTGTLGAKLNSQVTDDQILSDINTGNKARYKELYDIGNSAIVDLQSQLDKSKQFLSDLPANDSRRASTQTQIDSIQKDLTQAQADTLKSRDLYENYHPISGENASGAISSFRESLQLPEQRTLAQIKEIDPTTYESIINLQKQYATLAKEPVAPTTSPETEAFRRDVEQRIAGQVALGSQLGAEEQRQYQQAARAAQTARGNIFGVAPAVEEAVTTGAAGEQRLAARLGAAQGFLASGQTMSDAMARDVGLREALTQSRLGAAQSLIAGGPTLYNMASQRLGTQQNLLNNYLAASAPQSSGGFQATPSAANPYAYVNPNAGFVGAQNAADIFKTINDYTLGGYQAQVGAISRQQSGAQQFADIAGGIGGLVGKIAPGGFLCWVAREVYGNDNPKWIQFREWMLTKASDNLRNFYIKHGEKIAESIRNKPRIKAIIRKWMDGKIIELNGAV
jgi:hypothetical protein